MADEPISFNEQLRRLQTGNSLSVCERVPISEIHEGTEVTERVARMRRTINAQVSKLRDVKNGSNFRVESAVTLTNDNEAMLAVVAVTRL